MTRRHHAATAVATGSTDDRDATGRCQVDHQTREVASGVLHHLAQPDPQLVDHPPVHVDHRRRGEPTDRSAGSQGTRRCACRYCALPSRPSHVGHAHHDPPLIGADRGRRAGAGRPVSTDTTPPARQFLASDMVLPEMAGFSVGFFAVVRHSAATPARRPDGATSLRQRRDGTRESPAGAGLSWKWIGRDTVPHGGARPLTGAATAPRRHSPAGPSALR